MIESASVEKEKESPSYAMARSERRGISGISSPQVKALTNLQASCPA